MQDQDEYRVHSLEVTDATSPVEGKVHWDPLRSLWNGATLVGAVQASNVAWAALPPHGRKLAQQPSRLFRHGLYPGLTDVGIAFVKLQAQRTLNTATLNEEKETVA